MGIHEVTNRTVNVDRWWDNGENLGHSNWDYITDDDDTTYAKLNHGAAGDLGIYVSFNHGTRIPSNATILKMRMYGDIYTSSRRECHLYGIRNSSGTTILSKDVKLLGKNTRGVINYPSSSGGDNTVANFGRVFTPDYLYNAGIVFNIGFPKSLLTGIVYLYYFKLWVQYSLPDYTIKFVNYDGTTLQQKTVEEGTVPSYSGSTPTRPSTAQYTYKFAGWDKTVVAATGNTTYTAVYTTTINKYTVSTAASPSNGGSVPASRTVNYGTSLSLMASPNTGYEFLKWSDEELSNPRTVTVTSNVTYTAIFTKKTFNITLTSNDGGVVSPSSTIVEYGESFTFNITPSSGYVVSDVLLNSQSIGAVTTYTIDNVTNNYSIEVIFKKIIRMGSVEVSKVYVGAFEITKMYLGSNKIFG